MRTFIGTALVAGAMAVAANAGAATITYNVTGVLDGKAVGANVTFTSGAGTLAVSLFNTVPNPTSVIQNISGLEFGLGSLMTASLTSSSGLPRSVAGNGSYSDGAVGATDWLFSMTGSTVMLNGLGSGGPDQTIIGAAGAGGTYNANGSIAGNGPHNPFLAGVVTFDLAVAGLTPQDFITLGRVRFGTTEGSNFIRFECVAGDPRCTPPPACTAGVNCDEANVPEPASLLLLGAGLLGLAARLKR